MDDGSVFCNALTFSDDHSANCSMLCPKPENKASFFFFWRRFLGLAFAGSRVHVTTTSLSLFCCRRKTLSIFRSNGDSNGLAVYFNRLIKALRCRGVQPSTTSCACLSIVSKKKWQKTRLKRWNVDRRVDIPCISMRFKRRAFYSQCNASPATRRCAGPTACDASYVGSTHIVVARSAAHGRRNGIVKPQTNTS